MNFNVEEYLESLPINTEEIDLKYKELTYIPDLSKFINLKKLNCSFNKISSLPTSLPDTIEELILYQNELNAVSKLPYSLKTLCCSHNKNLTSLPNDLPNNLEKMYLYYNDFVCLPSLPNSLQILYICFNDKLINLPSLPGNLKKLYCYNNKLLTVLPLLPNGIKVVECHNNILNSISTIPNSLEFLICSNNKLTYLPKISENLIYLDCSNNQLYYIHDLLVTLKKLLYEGNVVYEIFNENNYYGNLDTESLNKLCIQNARKKIIKLNKLRSMYFSLRFKRQFWNLLWVKIREPKIREYYKPENLITKLLEFNSCEEDDNEALNTFLSNW